MFPSPHFTVSPTSPTLTQHKPPPPLFETARPLVMSGSILSNSPGRLGSAEDADPAIITGCFRHAFNSLEPPSTFPRRENIKAMSFDIARQNKATGTRKKNLDP